jgi:hypothetical protein
MTKVKVSLDKTVAIYIDGDQFKVPSYGQKLIDVCDYIGMLNNPSGCYIYGDWVKQHKRRKKIDDSKIQCIQVASGSEAVDNFIKIDIGKTLGDPENPIDIYVIVSSDGGFASLSQPILEAGKEVVFISKKGKAAKEFQNLTCYFLEDLEQHLSELESHYVIPIDRLRRFKANLEYTYAFHFGDHNEDRVSYTQLEEELPKALQPGEYEYYFGKYELSQLISYCSDDFEIDEQGIKKIDHHPERKRLFWLENAYRKVHSSEYEFSSEKLMENLRKPVSIAKLEKKLREIDRYYESHFGSKKLSHWLRQYPEFKVDKDNVLMLSPLTE